MAGRLRAQADRGVRVVLGIGLAGSGASIAVTQWTTTTPPLRIDLFSTVGFELPLVAAGVGLLFVFSTLPFFSKPGFEMYFYENETFQRVYAPVEMDRVIVGAADIQHVDRYCTMLRVKESKYRFAEDVTLEVVDVDPPYETYKDATDRLSWGGRDFTQYYETFRPGEVHWAILHTVLINKADLKKSTVESLSSAEEYEVILAITCKGKIIEAWRVKVSNANADTHKHASVSFLEHPSVRKVMSLQRKRDARWRSGSNAPHGCDADSDSVPSPI